MATIHVHRANGHAQRPNVEPATIVVDLDLPDRVALDTLEALRTLYRDDAKAIADALQRSLPGGTWSELLAELLSRHVCYFRVPIDDWVDNIQKGETDVSH